MNPEKGHLLILWTFLLTASIIFQGSNVSSQSISCQEEGIFPVLQYCDVYYRCESWRKNRLSISVEECPNGTVFDTETKTCLEPYLVTSRPECMPVLTTTAAPPPKTFQCEEEGMFPLEEYCDAYYKCNYFREGGPLTSVIEECPLGTVFDDEKDSCLDPYLVTSRPKCMPEDDLPTTATVFESVINEAESSNVLQVVNAETTTNVPLPSQEEEVVVKTNAIEVTSDLDYTTPKTAVSSDSDDTNRTPSEVTTETYIAKEIHDATIETNITQEINNVTTKTYIIEEINYTEAGDGVNDIPQMIQEVVKISRQTCQNVCVIGKYVTLMTSSVPLEVAHHRQSKFKDSLVSYNAALERSRNTVNTWSRGHDILSEIRRIFNLAKKYEPEFDRKYKIYDERDIASSPSSISDRTTDLLEDIEILEQDIRINEEIMETSSVTIRSLLLSQIQRYEDELERKNQMLQEILNSSGVTSPATFLVMVINEARNIENKTKDLKIRIAAWHSNLSDNERVLNEKSVLLSQKNENIKAIILNKNQTRIQKQNALIDLQGEKRTLESSISILQQQIDTNFEEVQAEKDVIRIKINEHEKKVNKTCDPNGMHMLLIPKLLKEFSTMQEVCRDLVRTFGPHVNLNVEYEKLQQIQNDVNRRNREKMNTINRDSTRITTIQDSLRQQQTEVQKLGSHVRNLEAETRRIQAFISQNGHVKQAWMSATEAIQAMIRDLDKVGTTFRSIYVNLEEMLSQVTEAENKTGENKPDFKEVRNAIDQPLKLLQTQIDQSSVNIQEIIDCPQVIKLSN